MPQDGKTKNSHLFTSSNLDGPDYERNDLQNDLKKDAPVSENGSVDYAVGELTADIKLDTSLQLVTKTLDITDDPSETAFTFRAFFIGLGLAAFGAVIAEIFYFKPQTVNVNVIFLEIIAFVMGEATTLIPRWGPVGKFINPGPFSQKEHGKHLLNDNVF